MNPMNQEISISWHDHLAAICAFSRIGKNVISHVEALRKFTQKTLDDSNQAIIY